jgi:hypothetical protein
MQRRIWAAVAGLTAVAFGLRLAELDQSLFGDELFMYRIVGHDGLDRVVRLVHDTESTPPLHFLLAWLGAKLGDPTVGMRIPSLVLGTATVPAAFALGRRTVGERAALFGAAVVAIAPFAILYGVEGRAYATLGLLSVLSTLALLRALDGSRWTRWALFAALTLAVLYTHYIGVFVVVAQGLWAACRHRERLRELALSHAAVAIGYAPWIPSFLIQRQDSAAVRIDRTYPLTPESFGRGLLKVVPGHPFVELSRLPGSAAVVVFLVAAAVAVALTARRRHAPRDARDRRSLELLILVALASPAGAVLYSLGPESVFLPRNLIASLPAATLVLGAAVLRAGRVAAPLVAAVLLGVLALGAVKTLDPDYQRPPYRQAADYIESNGRPGDPVLEVSVDPVNPLGSALLVQLDRRWPLARLGHPGAGAALARGRARGRLFLVVPQVGVLAGRPHWAPLRRFRLVGRRVFRGLADVGVFDYRPVQRPSG